MGHKNWQKKRKCLLFRGCNKSFGVQNSVPWNLPPQLLISSLFLLHRKFAFLKAHLLRYLKKWWLKKVGLKSVLYWIPITHCDTLVLLFWSTPAILFCWHEPPVRHAVPRNHQCQVTYNTSPRIWDSKWSSRWKTLWMVATGFFPNSLFEKKPEFGPTIQHSDFCSDEHFECHHFSYRL
jgi:hypothetical protein